MKTLETIAHAQIEFFIFIIRVPHVSSIDIYARAIDTLWENEIIVYMNICSTHFKLNKMSKIFDFDRILKTECNLLNFTRNCRIKNLNDFERVESDTYLWRAGLLNVKKKGMTICYIVWTGVW